MIEAPIRALLSEENPVETQQVRKILHNDGGPCEAEVANSKDEVSCASAGGHRVIHCAADKRRIRAQSAQHEKQDFLRDVQHHVKNNLQVIQSLLKMQARSLQKDETRAVIKTMAQRVHAMALVHEHFYQSEHPAHRSLANYLRELFNGALASHCLEPDQVRLSLEVDEISLSLERATPLGLLANELICNSLMHGFKDGRRGTIGVSIQRIDGAVHLEIKDDGAGVPAGFDLTSQPFLGLKLAASLAHQLGGELEFLSQNGCVVRAKLTRL
jgi:two-component sensor histidine kinase